jgi:hypothetical protein
MVAIIQSDVVGSVELAGSEAGKLSSRPSSSIDAFFRSSLTACFGLAASLSAGAGSNFLFIDAFNFI